MTSKMLVLKFPKETADQPVVVNLAKSFDLTFNILKARITPGQEGLMVMELSGTRKNFQEGVNYLKDLGVQVETIGQQVRRNDDKCYQCGSCTAFCPTGALQLSRPSMEVLFQPDKCSMCELCVPLCPPRAMEVVFNTSAVLARKRVLTTDDDKADLRPFIS
ncbi:MAG: 4Fe-4S binding protein [Deltaproteobacteria bacterium]|nr:4Fe-4S binding protein [Deltaproteobacteria bacterium]